MHWLYLIVAITAEVAATSALKASEGFTRLWPSLIVLVGYSASFYFLSLTLRVIPIGTAYAIWSGVGLMLIVIVGWMLFGQTIDAAAVAGFALIIAGVVVLNVFSSSVPH
ncbi:MAG: multidrug efflux SMR transporter [Nitrospinota bacterium]|nr:multidrug efflux SMR transporter [Nitrospinota bacterium]